MKHLLWLSLVVAIVVPAGAPVGRAGSRATLATPPASPTAIAARVEAVPPDQLYALLLSAPFPTDGLPDGIDQPVVRPWNTDDQALQGAVGGVEVMDPDALYPTVSFAVYPDGASAERAYARFVAEAEPFERSSVPVEGAELPAIVFQYGGLAICFVRVGNVVAFGLAVGPDEASVDDAVRAAAVAVAHLDRLATDYAAGVRPVYATGPLADVVPFALFDRLLATPLSDADLPAGFSGGPLTRWEEGDTDLIGTIGGAFLMFGGEAGIAFLVYPNEAAAQAKFDERVDDAVAEGLGVVKVAGIAYPSRLMTFADYGVCMVRVGYVLVIGSGGLDQGLAIDLARAGVAHVERLAAAPAPATAAT